jgi:hypothetical protein
MRFFLHRTHPARQPARRGARGPTSVALLAAIVGVAGCAKQEDVIIRASEGKELTAEVIDQDPIALLPGNAVGALTLDAKALFTSQFGQRLLAITQARSPLPAQAGFEPARDLERVYIGFYSMQGADVAGVAVGRFDAAKIPSAVRANPKTLSGAPVTESRYAGRTLYTSGGLGFSPLTERTLLFGNETGIRRALDRIEEGRARRILPKWMVTLLEKPGAPIVAGADLESQPVSAAVREQVAFVDGLRTLSFVGNFADPGLNLAGTLAYESEDAASRGADNLRKLHATLSSAGLLMALAGIPQPVRKLDAVAQQKETRFVVGVDAAAIAALLEKAQTYLGSLTPGAR